MRFDPKYIPGEDAPLDAAGDIELPDDLRELAAQLGEDARFLAELYPAGATAGLPSSAPLVPEVGTALTNGTLSRKTSLRWIASGLVIATSLLIAVVVSLSDRSPDREIAAPSAENIEPETDPLLLAQETPRVEAAVTPTHNGPRIQRLPWAPTPALGEVTGPELEGLLDLWENDDDAPEMRISL